MLSKNLTQKIVAYSKPFTMPKIFPNLCIYMYLYIYIYII